MGPDIQGCFAMKEEGALDMGIILDGMERQSNQLQEAQLNQ
jgi:hypothetical protein